MNEPCPLCENALEEKNKMAHLASVTAYQCQYCGNYILFGVQDSWVNSTDEKDKAVKRLKFRYALNHSPHLNYVGDYHYISNRFLTTFENTTPFIDFDKIKLPNPAQQLEWLLRKIYEDKNDFEQMTFEFRKLDAFCGTSLLSLPGLLQETVKLNHISQLHINDIQHRSNPFLVNAGSISCIPTFEGFQAYEALKKGDLKSKQVFMAVAFSTDTYTSEADEFYKNHWCFAVEETGFILTDQRNLNKAGNINAQMEAEIRRSKFLVADITPTSVAEDAKANPNVMWEAGFAEGLGKPVIYTCKKNPTNKTPFDVRNHATVFWDLDNPEAAKEELKAIIKNTFPDEVA